MVSASPGHRWYYFPRMQTDEILVFMGMRQEEKTEVPAAAVSDAMAAAAVAKGLPAKAEAAGPPGSGRQSPHIAFRDPSAGVALSSGASGRRPPLLPRRSVETRVLAAFRKKKQSPIARAEREIQKEGPARL